jgi:cytochrome c biogenesis protein CcdA
MVGGVGTAVVALLPFYVGYLLSRSARRIRSGVGGSAGEMKQRVWLKFCTAYVVVLIVGDLFVPFPSVLKVAMAISAVIVGVLLLAFELEPRKNKRVA